MSNSRPDSNPDLSSTGTPTRIPIRLAGKPRARPLLWLVRHSKPVMTPGLCYGRLDLEVDVKDIERTAGHLAKTLPHGIVVRHSPAKRCRLLAEALHRLRPDVQLYGAADGLAEMDFGAWEGRPWADLPEVELTAWTDDFSDYRPGETGESVRQFLARIERELQRVLDHHDAEPEPEPELWITHAGVIRAVAWLLDRDTNGAMPSADRWPAFEVGYGEIRVIRAKS
ncbi:MAG: histidine phosphatase family protein [Lautropia sp.]|nr:histidine phosphatase family protein [Lautropia sp.]